MNGINHIIVPEETDEYPYEPKTIQSWKKEFDPKKLEEKLLQRGREHFSQAQGTPFTEEPLRTMLPFMANSKFADKILEGKIPEELKISWVTRKVLEQAKRKRKESGAEFTENDVITGYRRWRESTSTSPSGRHLGHQKAI